MGCLVKPQQIFECSNATHYAEVQTYLDSIGYTIGVTASGARTDNAGTLTILVEYAAWPLEV